MFSICVYNVMNAVPPEYLNLLCNEVCDLSNSCMALKRNKHEQQQWFHRL